LNSASNTARVRWFEEFLMARLDPSRLDPLVAEASFQA